MTYVRNAWYVAAWAHELAMGRLAGVRILNEPIVIWRNAAGDLAAFEDRCIHRLAPLSLGRCEGEKLRCMYHGLLYDRTGRVVEIPGQDRIASSLRVRTYPVVERHSWIWVWMGDVAAADERLIPPAVGMEDVDQDSYVFGHGQVDFAADARLVYDNLLDLSHISFLHAESLRMGEIWAMERPNVTEQERSVRSERWFRYGSRSGSVYAEESGDTHFCCDCFVPGIVVLTNRTYPVGTADALSGNVPDLNEPEPSGVVSHAITPMTDKSTRQFYLIVRPRRGEETAHDTTIEERAFVEDKTMIEAQQRNIDVTPGHRFIPTQADRAVLLFNRLTEKLSSVEKAT